MYLPLTVGMAGLIMLCNFIQGKYSNPISTAAAIVIVLDYYVI